jgi:hypothetical protein
MVGCRSARDFMPQQKRVLSPSQEKQMAAHDVPPFE